MPKAQSDIMQNNIDHFLDYCVLGVTFLCLVFMQVVQKSGRVIGSCELNVANDRVDVSRLDVAVVSGLSLSVSAKTDFPGALSLHVVKTNLMHHRYQVAKVSLSIISYVEWSET